jgi:N-formylglutamate deformylase
MHALQVEVNRSLYLDEDRIELAAAFPDIRRRLLSALAELVTIDLDALRPSQRGMRLAAE